MKISQETIMRKIAIRQPYFALQDIEKNSDGITAYITAEQPQIRGEIGSIGAGEIARHLAIAGTIANGLKDIGEDLIYYLATGAELKIFNTVAEQEGKDFRIESAGERINKREAKAISVLKSRDGNTVYSVLKTSYYLLTQKAFSKLYKEHYKDLRENDRDKKTEQDRKNIYSNTFRIENKNKIDNKIISKLKINASNCMGHFPLYPALPVAFCCNYLFALSSKLVKEKHFYPVKSIVRAKELIFASDTINFEIELLEQKKLDYNFDCRVKKNDDDIIRLFLILRGV